jgi:hypothetical protein
MPTIGDKAQTLATEAELRRLAQRGIGSKARQRRPFKADTVEPTEPSPVQAQETGTCAACGKVTVLRVYRQTGEAVTGLFACGYHGGRP